MILFVDNATNVQNISYICDEQPKKYLMNQHFCILCLGSNSGRHAHIAHARRALTRHFPDIRFGEEMETEAIGCGFLSPFSNQLARFSTLLSPEEVRSILKSIEKDNGRLPEDKAQGIVKLDIDLLMYDEQVLKPKDMEKDFVRQGLKAFK